MIISVSDKDTILHSNDNVNKSVRKWVCNEWVKQLIKHRNMTTALVAILIKILCDRNTPVEVKRWVESWY